MDCVKVGRLIHSLRTEKGMTQKALADRLHLSDRTVSKWERGMGCPDITLLNALADIFGVNMEKLLNGDLAPNESDGGNMKRTKFYVCPSCGNVLCSTGTAEISCCGRKLVPLMENPPEASHAVIVENIDNELYLTMDHEMTKQHFITFAAYVACDRMTLVKLYPEQDAQVRFPWVRGGDFYVCCSEHGLFRVKNKTAAR